MRPAIALFIGVCSLCSLSTDLAAEASKPVDREAAGVKEDLARFQGTWEMLDKSHGRIIRSRQVIAGNRCTVTRTNEQGDVVSAHTADFELSRSGQTRVFTYFNLRVTAGPDKGRVVAARRSFLYRLTPQAFYEAYGLLVGQEEEPSILVWRRVKDRVAGRALLPSAACL